MFDPAAPLHFLINAASGSEALEESRAAIEAVLAASGRRAELRACSPAELPALARETARCAAAQRGAIVAVGGDGTLNTVVQAAHAAGCTMGVVPRGTFNYFARSHGIEPDVTTAVQQLLLAQPMPVRVAALNDHIFLVNASLGLYPELLEDREEYKARFGRSRWVAIGAGIVTLLGAQRRLRLHIELGAGARDVRALTIFVGHNRLQLAQWGVDGAARRVPGEAHAAAEGAHLTAVMVRPIGTLALLGLLWHGALGTLGEAESVEHFEFDHMVVRPSRLYRARRVKVAFDGEVAWVRPPLDFRVLARPLMLLKPVAAGAHESTDGPAAPSAHMARLPAAP